MIASAVTLPMPGNSCRDPAERDPGAQVVVPAVCAAPRRPGGKPAPGTTARGPAPTGTQSDATRHWAPGPAWAGDLGTAGAGGSVGTRANIRVDIGHPGTVPGPPSPWDPARCGGSTGSGDAGYDAAERAEAWQPGHRTPGGTGQRPPGHPGTGHHGTTTLVVQHDAGPAAILVGLVAQAGFASLDLAAGRRARRRPRRGRVVGVSGGPPELTRTITLHQTVDLVRVLVDVVESQVDSLAAPGDEALLREAVLRFSREIAFAAAGVYARAAEARGAWDARLEALVVDALLRGESDDELRSRAAALGWTGAGPVCVVVGGRPAGDSAAVLDSLQGAARLDLRRARRRTGRSARGRPGRRGRADQGGEPAAPRVRSGTGRGRNCGCRSQLRCPLSRGCPRRQAGRDRLAGRATARPGR